MIEKAIEKLRKVIGSSLEFIDRVTSSGRDAIASRVDDLRIRFLPITPKDVEKIPDKYKLQIGLLKAEIAKRDEKIKRLEKKLEYLSGERRSKLINLIEQKRASIVKFKGRRYIRLGMDMPSDIRVLTREHKFIGWFSYFLIGDGTIRIVVSEQPNRKGRKYEVWRGTSLDYLFHHYENLEEQIRSKVMVLNRTWDGYYVPEIEGMLPKTFPIEGKVRCKYCKHESDNMDDLVQHYRSKHKPKIVGSSNGGEAVGS